MTPDERALSILGSLAMRLQLQTDQIHVLLREHINEALSEERASIRERIIADRDARGLLTESQTYIYDVILALLR